MEGNARNLGHLSVELRRMRRLLSRVARSPARSGARALDAEAVRALLAARRLREECFGPAIGDVAWALLLDAFAARLEGRAVVMTRLGAGAGVPRSTAHRWVARLLERGLLVHQAGAGGERTASVCLSDDAAARIRDYLATAIRMAPGVI